MTKSPPPFGFTRRRVLALGAATSATALLATRASAQLRLDVTQGNVQPIPIAIPDFVGGTPNDAESARGITQVITNNLRRSGLFNPIDPAAYIEKIASFDMLPRFPDWRAINAQGLITGRVTRSQIFERQSATSEAVTSPTSERPSRE